jgi:hypothetical protein
VSKEMLVPKVSRVIKDPQRQKVLKEIRDRWVPRVLKVLKVLMDLRDLVVTKVLKGIRLKDHKEFLVRLSKVPKVL